MKLISKVAEKVLRSNPPGFEIIMKVKLELFIVSLALASLVTEFNGAFASGTGEEVTATVRFHEFVLECTQNNGVSCRSAGTDYYKGLGTPISTKDAVRLWKRGCELQDAGSCRLVAAVFFNGKSGVSEDEAADFLVKSCKLGDPAACTNLRSAFPGRSAK